MTIYSLGILQRKFGFRKELIIFTIIGMFAAYPFKAYLLSVDLQIFSTYKNYNSIVDTAPYLAYIIFMIFIMLGFLAKKTIKNEIHNGSCIYQASAYMNFINSIALFLVAIMFSGITSPIDLLSPNVRREFLFSQQGNGWSSLLIVWAIPLLALGYKAGHRFIFFISFSLVLISYLIIGSRQYLFGLLIAFLICKFQFSLKTILLVFFGFGLIGSFVYLNFLSQTTFELDIAQLNTAQLLSFLMHTFDSADILNTYLSQSENKIYYGLTILEEIFITYFPRFFWEDKPYLFGAIRITTDLFPNLEDVQSIGATFPPGLLLELYANFGLISPVILLLIGMFFAWLSDNKRLANPFAFALYVSLCAVAPLFFRGLGSLITLIFPVLGLFVILALIGKIISYRQ